MDEASPVAPEPDTAALDAAPAEPPVPLSGNCSAWRTGHNGQNDELLDIVSAGGDGFWACGWSNSGVAPLFRLEADGSPRQAWTVEGMSKCEGLAATMGGGVVLTGVRGSAFDEATMPVLKLAADGEIVWAGVVRGATATVAGYDVAVLPDESIVVVGHDGRVGHRSKRALVVRIADGPGEGWARAFAMSAELRAVAAVGDDRLAVAGFDRVSDASGDRVERGLVAMLRTDGTVEWVHRLHSGGEERDYAVVEVPQGIVVGGGHRDRGVGGAHLTALDPSGAVVWAGRGGTGAVYDIEGSSPGLMALVAARDLGVWQLTTAGTLTGSATWGLEGRDEASAIAISGRRGLIAGATTDPTDFMDMALVGIGDVGCGVGEGPTRLAPREVIVEPIPGAAEPARVALVRATMELLPLDWAPTDLCAR